MIIPMEWVAAVVYLGPRSFFWQWAAVNAEIWEWSECRE